MNNCSIITKCDEHDIDLEFGTLYICRHLVYAVDRSPPISCAAACSISALNADPVVQAGAPGFYIPCMHSAC